MSTHTPQQIRRALAVDLERTRLELALALALKGAQEDEIERAKQQNAPAAGSTVATGATVDSGAAGDSSSKPKTRSEVARLGALARWGKYKGKGKKKGNASAKDKKTPEQLDAEHRAEAQKQRLETMGAFGEAGTDLLRGLEALASGKAPEEDDADELIAAGLAERVGTDGTIVLTSNGRKLYNVAGAGDVGMAREVLARAKDGIEKSAAAAAEKQKADEEKAKADEEKKCGGGGGGGGKDAATAEQEKQAAAEQKEQDKQAALEQKAQDKQAALEKKQLEKQAAVEKAKAEQVAAEKQKRADVMAAFGDQGGELLAGLDTLRAGGELDEEQSLIMLMAGLAEPIGPDGEIVLSAAGRKLDKAATAGDVGLARDTLARAKADVYAKIRAAHQATDGDQVDEPAAAKHMPGAHDQRAHGRSTARRQAYRAAYSQARSGGASPAEARTAGKTASAAIPKEPRANAGGSAPAKQVATSPNRDGETTTAYGTDPTKKYSLQHKLVDMSEIEASNTQSGAINPHYDQALQPRDRSRAASQAQIDDVARKMNADVLVTDFHRIDSGSPIIDEHGNVLSGNGRTLALQRAAELYPEQYAAYKQRVKEEAERLGIDPAAVDGMKNPVLVRQLDPGTDAAAFAREANSSGTLRMSPLEQAKVDAHVMSDKNMLALHVTEGQDIDRALRDRANKPFVDSFLQTVPENERANLVTRDGSLNQAGLYRIKAAVYTKAFPGEHGERMAESMLESLDPDVKTIQNGISGALPSFSRATSLARSGERSPDLDISGDVAKVVDVYARIKDNPHLTANTPADKLVAKYLSQSTMFDRELTPQQEKLLTYVDTISRKPTAVKDFLQRYARTVEAQPHPNQSSLFGDDTPRMSKDQLIDYLIAGGGGEPAAAQVGMFA